MRVYIITGEASGDWYGAQIIKSLKAKDVHCDVRYWGGDAMLSESPHIVKHIRDTAYMGFIEVVKNLRKIRANINLCKTDIKAFDPDIILFIDYPGFNLRIAEWAKSQDYHTVWYISPKVWAWKESRVQKMKQAIDHLFVIFPFEVQYFSKFGVKATYLGNPLAYRIQKYRIDNPVKKDAIILMPGSRTQELKRHLSLMYDYATSCQSEQFILPLAQGFTPAKVRSLCNQEIPSNIMFTSDSWAALNRAKSGVIASGTATLEAMLFEVPQVVIYKANPISYQIAKRLVKIQYISLVNILANRPVITELIQNDATLPNLKHEMNNIENNHIQITNDYREITSTLATDSQPFDALVSRIYELYRT